MTKDGQTIEMGGKDKIPEQLGEIVGDLVTVQRQIHALALTVGQPDLPAPENLEEGPPTYGGILTDLLAKLGALEERVDLLAHDVRADVEALAKRVAELEST